MSDLLNDLLAVPTALTQRKGSDRDADVTRKIEVSSNSIDVTINDEPGVTTEGSARAFLESEDLDPDAWEVASFRKSEWDAADGSARESVAFTFKPVKATGKAEGLSLDVDGMLERFLSRTPVDVDRYHERRTEDIGFVVALGDMQFGKMDGDGPEGALARAFDYIDKAALEAENAAFYGYVDHIHIAWLGDHIEGFQSQGGANAWRTVLTLTEQIRLTRRVMEHALFKFAPMAHRVSMAAVPGNHGETVRFEGKGVTRYDDSHDTEALVAISDAAKYNDAAFGHVEFYVPETDEMTVTLDVAGTRIAHAHGHQWRPNKHFEWWQGQAFNRDSLLGEADLMLSGHLHHAHIEEDGDRLFVGVPALESESTWYRHNKGTGGSPGLLTAVVQDGAVSTIRFVR